MADDKRYTTSQLVEMLQRCNIRPSVQRVPCCRMLQTAVSILLLKKFMPVYRRLSIRSPAPRSTTHSTYWPRKDWLENWR